ncbi:hypothetical protein PFWH6_3988 [Pseudomonas fluorescens WH6]|nr:hypothetical protein PFWH6_3988 [Pseudomonas fluorescens WH6]
MVIRVLSVMNFTFSLLLSINTLRGEAVVIPIRNWCKQ